LLVDATSSHHLALQPIHFKMQRQGNWPDREALKEFLDECMRDKRPVIVESGKHKQARPCELISVSKDYTSVCVLNEYHQRLRVDVADVFDPNKPRVGYGSQNQTESESESENATTIEIVDLTELSDSQVRFLSTYLILDIASMH
jgi:hypothetical protein